MVQPPLSAPFEVLMIDDVNVYEPDPMETQAPPAEDPQVKLERMQECLGFLLEEVQRPDKSVRENIVQEARQGELYWEGIQNIFWDSNKHEWRVASDPTVVQFSDEESNDKVINIYRAYGESVIAALSVGIPKTKFFPADADSIDDIMTAKAFSRIVEKVERDNDAGLLFLRTLFLLWTQGFVGIYNTYQRDPKFGSVTHTEYGTRTHEITETFCPECGETVQDVNTSCPSCGYQGPMETNTYDGDDEVFVKSVQEIPKGRELMEVYGALNVKMATYVRRPEDSPYILLETEHHISTVLSIYPELREKVVTGTSGPGYDRQARLEGYHGWPGGADIITLKRLWLRPQAFAMLEKEKVDEYLKMFPQGVYCVFIDNQLVEILPEDPDECWTFYESPLSKTLYGSPIGRPLVQIQDMKNELVTLEFETIEHGIPETFVDPYTVNLNVYGERQPRPGELIPARARPGMSMDGSFYSTHGATLSKEVQPFEDRIDALGQLVVGATPHIWGGAEEGGSKTAQEYETRKNQALQRLNLIWKIVCIMWGKAHKKAATSYRNNLLEDEKFVQKAGSGFTNVWIRLSELQGEVGEIDPETSEQFPMSWPQIRGMLLDLMQMGIPEINTTLFHPENAPLVARYLGADKLYIPGENDRDKQLLEISELMRAQPFGPDMSSIPPDFGVDDDALHIEVCKAWLVSPAGREAKLSNPAGYENVLIHMRQHEMYVMQQQAQMMEQQALMGGMGAPDQPPPAEENENA